MFVYLSKKIALQNQSRARCLSWSQDHGFIACGGDDGLLKVLKLESHCSWPIDSSSTSSTNLSSESTLRTNQSISSAGSNEDGGGRQASSAGQSRNVSMNQTLDGHSSSVVYLAWNEKFEKLTSSDDNGLIIVWMFYKGSWYEEMVNNRNKSTVIGMKWTIDGQKICIVYEDGSVIVGSVDGNRLWTKEIKSIRLTCVEWAPDSRYMLFGSNGGQVHCYDASGNFMSKITLGTGVRNQLLGTLNQTGGLSSPNSIATNYATVSAIRWFSSEYEEGIRRMQLQRRYLAVAQQNGQVHLLRSELDEEPLLLETRLQEITCIEWNCTGTVLAIGGVMTTSSSTYTNHTTSRPPDQPPPYSNVGETATGQRKLVVLFYSPESGEVLHSLTVPGNELVGCSWERYGLRIALAVDTFVYFAHVRPNHLWTHFADTFAYALPSSRQLFTLLFCQLRSGKYSAKTVAGLMNLQSCGQYCVLATDQDVQTGEDDLMNEAFLQQNQSNDNASEISKMRSSMFICNSIGTSVDTVNVEFKINHLAMNNIRVFAAGTDSFCIWRFRSPWKNSGFNFSSGAASESNDASLFYGDSLETDQTEDGGGGSGGPGFDRLFNVTLSRTDPICGICCSDKLLVVGQKSGAVQVYQLPRAVLSQRLQIQNLYSMRLNSESTRLAMMDTNRELRILDLEQSTQAQTNDPPIKDVWDFCWSSDNGQWLGYIQRGRLFVLDISSSNSNRSRAANNGGNKQSASIPTLGSTLGYICNLADLQVTIVLLDHLLLQLQQLITGVLALNANSPTSDRLHPVDFIQKFDSDLLKQARQQFEKQSLSEVASFIEQHSHPRLWRLLAESALQRLQLPAAELGFVRERDLHGVQFVKRISQLADDRWRRAEVQLYFGKPEEAESIYLSEGRTDLALQMWRMMGNWSRVWQLLQEQGSVDQQRLDEARAGLADELQKQGDFAGAATHYACLGDLRQLVHCCVLGHQFDRLVATVRVTLQNAGLTQVHELVGPSDQDHKFYTNLSEGFEETITWPDDASGWSDLADLMQSLGECELAAQCFLAADQPQQAIDCCVKLNQWRLAIRLATQQRSGRVKQLLAGYASQLAEKRRWLDVMQLYSQANQQSAAWKVLMSIAERARTLNWSPWMMKKLYILVGLLATGNQNSVNQGDSIKSSTNNNQSIKAHQEKIIPNQEVSNRRSMIVPIKNASTKLQALLDEDGEKQEDEEDQLQLLKDIRRASTTSLDRKNSVDISSESDINQDLLSCLDGMNSNDTRFIKKLDDQHAVREMQLRRQPWKGAEAYHFFLLAQSQLQEGYVDAAMNTALLLMEFEQFLSPLQIYTLIALTAAANRNMAVCSKAFIRLEALEQDALDSLLMQDDENKNNSQPLNDSESLSFSSDLRENEFNNRRGRFATLAVQLFTRQPPKVPRASSSTFECPICEAPLSGSGNGRCSKCDTSFSICVASGRPILEHGQAWSCGVCHHQAIQSDLVGYTLCPLCHHAIENK